MTRKRSATNPANNDLAADVDAKKVAFDNTPSAEVSAAEQKIQVLDYSGHTRKVISEEFLDIVEAMAKKSKQGSLAHTKYLFEIGRVKEEIQRQGRGKDEPTLADLLLAEMRRHREAESAKAEDAAKPDDEADDDEEEEEEEQEAAGDTQDDGQDCGAKAQ